MGLGPTAIRDMVSTLKHDGIEDLSIAPAAIDRAVGFGISQSGRFLRTFLYYGFNEDEKRRRVFDGVISHVAGGGRGSFNHRFAQASRDAHPFMNFFFPTDIFPFTDVEQLDPETGVRDGILTHRLERKFWPKIFYTNSSYEYWGRAASLIHTSVDGREDIALYDNVSHLHVREQPARPGGIPTAGQGRTAAEQPDGFPLVDAGLAESHGPLDSRRGFTAAEPLSAAEGRHAGARGGSDVSKDSRCRVFKPRPQGVSR